MNNRTVWLIIAVSIFLSLAFSAYGKSSPYWKVHRINIAGNASINKADLLGVMDLTPRFMVKPLRFSESRLRSDLYLIEKYYKSEGYLFAKVKADSIQRDSSKYRVSVFIGIQEGERTFVDSIKFTQHRGEFDSSVLKKVIKSKSGKPLLFTSLDEDCQKLGECFASKGFLNTEIKPELSIDSLHNKANVNFLITEGPRIRVGKIQLKGSGGLARRVTYRALEFKSGDTLTLDKIRKSEQQLYRTNLFRFVKIEPVLFDSTDTISATSLHDSAYPVDVRVNKADYFQIQTGVGYGTSEGIRTSLNTSYGNFFKIGQKLTLLGNFSNKLQHGELIYSIPWFLGIPSVEFDASLYFNRYDSIFGEKYNRALILSESNNPYRGLFEGWKLTFGRPTDYDLSYQLWIKFEDVRWLSPTIPDSVPKENTQSIGFGISYDTRSDLIDPEQGILNVVKTDVAGLTGINSARFVKVTNDFSIYWNYRKLRFASALKLGFAIPYGDSLEKARGVPLQEQFTAGGTRSVRGYKENCLAVDDSGHSRSGDILITANLLEIRFPIFWLISGALFTDAGYVWSEESFFHRSIVESLKEIRCSAGPGLRLNTAIATIRFDAGFKLGWRKRGESPYELHFDIGQAF